MAKKKIGFGRHNEENEADDISASEAIFANVMGDFLPASIEEATHFFTTADIIARIANSGYDIKWPAFSQLLFNDGFKTDNLGDVVVWPMRRA